MTILSISVIIWMHLIFHHIIFRMLLDLLLLKVNGCGYRSRTGWRRQYHQRRVDHQRWDVCCS